MTAITATITAEIEQRNPIAAPRLDLDTAALPLDGGAGLFTGINILSLWVAGAENGFNGRHWMTAGQAADLGGVVKKPCKGKAAGLIYGDKVNARKFEDGALVQCIAYIKADALYNSDQIDGLPAEYYAAAPTPEAAKWKNGFAVDGLEVGPISRRAMILCKMHSTYSLGI